MFFSEDNEGFFRFFFRKKVFSHLALRKSQEKSFIILSLGLVFVMLLFEQKGCDFKHAEPPTKVFIHKTLGFWVEKSWFLLLHRGQQVWIHILAVPGLTVLSWFTGKSLK